jgi:hypothetical protein
MPVYEITSCLGEINCELNYYQLAKLNELASRIEQVELGVKYLFLGLCGMIAVVFIWNVLKSIF